MADTSEDEAFEDASDFFEDDESCLCTSLRHQSLEDDNKDSCVLTDDVPAPGDLTVQSISTHFAVLIWDPPEGIDIFELSFYTDGEQAETRTTNSNSAEVEKLKPGTEYTFSVASVTEKDWRSSPVTVSAFTKPVPPERIQVNHVSADSVSLRWKSPDFPVWEYHVTCWQGDQLVQEMATKSNKTTFNNLSSGVQYSIKVTTVLENGSESKIATRYAHTKTSLEGLLVNLGLMDHFKDKLSLSTVLQISEKTITDKTLTSPLSLPWCFLKRLMMVNVTARSVKCVSTVDENWDSADFDICNDLDSLVECQDSSIVVNPLDIVTALFLCSDGFLQQEMTLKMSMCQFSVPLLLPSSDTNQPMFMLWALRDIVKKFRPHSLEDPRGFVEERIVLSALPMVSFVRLGKCGFSKSQILNKLLSNPQQYHDTFLHHDMDCGDSPRKISDGLVEISWYLPCGNKNIDIFPEPVTVANLRGDICSFETQYSFLCQTSSAVFVFFDSLDTEHKILTTQHHKAQLFLVGNAQSKNFNIDALKLVASELNLKKANVILKVKQMNDADFVKNLRSTITNWLKGDPSKMQLEQMVDIAHELGIRVDEDNKGCQNAKTNAFEITTKIEDTLQFKESQLPLQGKIWKELAKLEKEECRLRKAGDQNIEIYKSELQEQKLNLREEQRGYDMSEAMTCFINALTTSRLERSYFLKWMRMNLDNLSRKSLTGLRDQYKEKCQDSVVNKEEIKDLDKQISNSSLGIEHFVREMGQLYESTLTLPKESEARQQMMHLPELCAKLLLDGFPLELVDGDASNIPLHWVKNVLGQLDRLVKPRNKILVVTVLGVQSTGKSTLLNTMFGVQFAVSSGRCTRGAFMLLIKVSDDLRNKMDCDFLVIIDTEGLKSPELAQLDDSYEHDNELATLVIGLSDVTIINIAMENSTEMKDILQIVVHAFLRMKEVGKKPICQFVHQNVADVSAHDKNLRDRKLLLEQLNEMTQAAAKMEGKEENQKFTDVMEYDPEIGNWYIPGLWHGNPPMAPVNAGYSEAVYDFKKTMVQVFGNIKETNTSGNIKDFLEWTKSLWNAVKYENFIFSFRNSLVADAYMRLCTEYHKWEWDFKKHMYSWLTSAETKISNFEVIRTELDNDINYFLCQLKTKAVLELDQREKVVLNSLTEYFKQTEGHVYLVERYREDFTNNVKCLRRDLENSVLRKLELASCISQGMRKLENIKKTHTDLLGKRVLALLEKCKTSSSRKTDSELEKIFEKVWQETVSELALHGLEHNNIVSNVYHHLRSNLKQKGGSVHEMINNVNLLECGIHPFTVTAENFIQRIVHKVKKFFFEDFQMKAQEVADNLIQKCVSVVDEKCLGTSDYHENYIEDILHKIDDTLSANRKLHTSEIFEVSLKLHICGIAARCFQDMHDHFIQENDPCRCLEQFKEKYFTDFKDLYNERDQCKRKAEEFTTLCLKPAVESWVAASLGPDIVDEVLMGKNALQFSTRAFFQYSLLRQLLLESNFESYVRYICFYKDFVKEWIYDRIREHFANGNKMSQLEDKYLKTISKEILEAIQTTQKQTHSGATVKEFIQKICRELEAKLAIPKDAVDAVMALSNAKVEPFAHSLSGFIQDLERSLKNTFLKLDTETRLQTLKMKPQDELFKRVFGCGKGCPFCKAPCEAGGDVHTDHWASIHRPEGLGKYRFTMSEKLVTEICSSSVFSDRKFKCYETNQEYHPFKKYREIFPDWHIPADPSIQASDYWKYVMVKFNQQFAERYKAKPANIPIVWLLITKEQAEDSLKESFSIK
ncbi:interferon-induced very large GTPase 1-like [Alosa pseudoharengus]|uniref:interferon-induced very large GTPase 1-like n=1 Tax=Alosa pseudoharengus TaxID=34774 RepID=UPI003F89E660